MAFLLDTSIAVDLRDERVAALDRLSSLSGPYAFSILTIVELEGGIAANPLLRERRRQAVDRLLANTEVLAFNDDVVSVYREVLTVVGFSRSRILESDPSKLTHIRRL